MTAGENRHNLEWLAAINAALDEVEAADAVLVTTGEGRFFSNGLDLDWIMSGADTSGFFEGLHALFARVLTFPTATAAAMNPDTMRQLKVDLFREWLPVMDPEHWPS